jgi:large subunit ribosomal protein L13
MTQHTRQTKVATAEQQKADWLLIDAQGVVLGRLASLVAMRLRGKHKPQFTPNLDCGDHVVIINAEKVKLTGGKAPKEKFHWHTGHPGGVKEITFDKILAGKHPERLIMKAVERMLPKESPLARKQFAKLRVYAGNQHPHIAQNPQVFDAAALNPKNKRDSQ